MPVTLTGLSDLAALPFDQIIDARSPAEFAEDHIPGAINLPSLSNEERAQVGTIYVRQSRFLARKVGAAMVARNIAAHLEGPLADKDGGWRPLVYCWRGGQRSGAFASYLVQIGWRAETIAGGYKTYRRLVADLCHDAPFPAPVVLLDGLTGTAKTDLLYLLAGRGVQMLDLEGAANHRGSAFGARRGGQPSQKQFEGILAAQIARLDPTRPVVIEAESSKIGTCILPPSLWEAMKGAPRLTIAAPLEARSDYLTQAYDDLWTNPEGLAAGLEALRPLHAAATIARWQALIAQKDFHRFVEEVIEQHYDRRYGRAAKRATGQQIYTDRLDAPGLQRTADQIMAALSALPNPAGR